MSINTKKPPDTINQRVLKSCSGLQTLKHYEGGHFTCFLDKVLLKRRSQEIQSQIILLLKDQNFKLEIGWR